MNTKPRNIIRELEERKYQTVANYPSGKIVPHLLPTNFSILDRYGQDVYCGEFSKDGRHFMCACKSGEISVYTVGHKSMDILKTYACRDIQWSIIDCKLSPDSRFIAYSSWSGNVHLLPFQSNPNSSKKNTEMYLSLSDHQSYYSAFCAFGVSFSADSRELIAGTNDGRAIIYDLQTGVKAVSIDNAHIADLSAITFSNQTNHIIYSAADDGILKIWDRRILSESHPEPISVFVGHQHGITWLDSKGDFRNIITNSKDQTIKLWDTRRPSKLSDLKHAQKVVRTNSQLWDYRQVRPSLRIDQYHTYVDKKRSQFDPIDVDDSVQTYTGHTVSYTLIRARFSPAFSTLQKYIYSGSSTGQLFVWDILSGEVVHKSKQGPGECHNSIVRDVSWHPYEPMIMTSSLDHTLGCTQYRDVKLNCDRRDSPGRYEDEYMDEGNYWL